MSNRRRPSLGNLYRTEYLRSPVWFARRDRWFTEEADAGRPLMCAGCGVSGTKRQLQLHHLEYTGLHDPGPWRALERHEDLIPMHAACHELLHRLIDRDPVLSFHRTRRDATLIALAKLRPELEPSRNPS